MESPSMKVCKDQLDKGIAILLSASLQVRDLLWAEGWPRDIQKGPFQAQSLWIYKYVWLVLQTLHELKKNTPPQTC